MEAPVRPEPGLSACGLGSPSPYAGTGTITGGATNAAYKNIVNDVAIDPKNPAHVIAAIEWRSGDTYNGFYETQNASAEKPTWVKINPTGAINPKNIGYATFAFCADGSKL